MLISPACVVLCFFSIEMVTFRFWWRCCHLPEAGVVTWVGRWVSRWVGVGQIVATSQLSGAGHTSFPGNCSVYSFLYFPLFLYTCTSQLCDTAVSPSCGLVKLWSSFSHQWMLPLYWVAQVTHPSACWWSNGWGWWRVFDPLLLWSQLVIVAISQLGAVVTTPFSVISYCTVQLLMVKQVRAVSDLSTLLVAPVCSYTDWSLCSANVVTSENHSTVSNVNTCK